MAIDDVEIVPPEINGSSVTVEVEVYGDNLNGIKVLVAVEKNGPTDVLDPWNPSSPGYWAICTLHRNDEDMAIYRCTTTRPPGEHYVRARASITGDEDHYWRNWKVDDDRIKIIVPPPQPKF
jgi:hypothetical protein